MKVSELFETVEPTESSVTFKPVEGAKSTRVLVSSPNTAGPDISLLRSIGSDAENAPRVKRVLMVSGLPFKYNNFKANKLVIDFGELPIEDAMARVEALVAKATKSEARWRKQRERSKAEAPERRKAYAKVANAERKARLDALAQKYGKENVRRVTARKYEGDDQYSWAVFVDGRPAFTGLGADQVNYYKKMALDILTKKNAD